MATGPAYMNSITSHSKVKTTITLSGPLFVAGQDITGKVELECKAEREVGIGLIIVELLAVQELNSRDHTAATTFVHSHRIFQGPGLPPSNAVYDRTTPQDPFFPTDYFPGRKGITTFFFKFPTPVTSPSSVSFASDLAKIEYKIRVNVGVAYKGDIRLLTNNVNTELVQCQDMEGTLDEHIAVGEGGKMYVRGKLIGGRVVPGEKACLELYVKNQTSHKTTGLTLTLTRSLHLHGTSGASVPVQLTDTLLSESFRSADYCVSPNTEGIANLVFTVPSSTRVVKGGLREGNVDKNGARKQIEPLFELRCHLSVKIGMGLGSKDILFEMPIQVKHRATLTQDATHDRHAYLSPVSPEPIFNRTMSPLPSHSPRTLSPMLNPHVNSVSPIPYASQMPALTQNPAPFHAPAPPKPVIHPRVLNPGDPHNARAVSPRLWSPTSLSPVAPYSPHSPLPNVYYFPPLPPPPPGHLLPFAFPARPNSADPYYYPYYYQNQTTLPSGLPPASPYSPFQLPFHNHNRPPLPPIPTQPPALTQASTQPRPPLPTQVSPTDQPEIPPTPSHPPESADQPVEGKGERASRIAHHLHTSNRARSASPTSHRFQVTSVSTIKQQPPSIPLRPYATSSRHLPVLSPRPVVSPSRTYVGHSPGTIGNGTTKSDRVDLLEQLVDVAPGEEEKSVEEVLRDLEEAERAGRIKVDSEPSNLPISSNNAQPKKSRSLLDVFNRDAEGERKDGNASTPSLHQPNPVYLYDQRNEGLDALERRLLQEVGTRKPDAIRPAVFSLGLADKLTTPDPAEQSIAVLDKDESRPPSPCTVRLHPRQHRESQISELALGLDNGGDKSPAEQKPPSPILQKPKQGVEQAGSTKQLELKQPQKAVDSRDDAKGRVSAWLTGLPSFSPSMSHADPAPVTHLAEPKKAPPRKRSIDGVLEFFGINKNKSREDLRASSPVVPASPVLPKHADIPRESFRSNDGLTAPSNAVSPQRRTPSPRRKPAPLYVEPAEETSHSQPDSVTNALPNDLLDTPVPLKPSLKAGQRNGATTNVGETPVIQPSKPLSRPNALPRGKEHQSVPEVKKAKLPIAPVKPDVLRHDFPKPTHNPLSVPKATPNSLESSLVKSPNAASVSSPDAKLQARERVKVKDTLPPIPASTRQKLALPISNFDAKYDVRSARGGRGGITTSVAAIWASRAETNGKESDPSTSASATPRSIPMTTARRLDGEAMTNPASTTTGAARKALPEHTQLESLDSSSEASSRDPIKGTSVPAEVHRYHATPQLSSAATLAQPVLNAKYKPPALSMTLSTVFEPASANGGHGSANSAVKTGEVHFGQARLKELIKKYQQGAS